MFLFASATLLSPSLLHATPPKLPPYHAVIPDVEPIRRTYYYVADRAIRIQDGSLRVWRDDAIPHNNVGTALPGLARLDPLQPSDSTNPEIRGNFDLLRPDEDYTATHRWTDGTGSSLIPVIRLSRALNPYEVLAVSYVDEMSDPPVPVGDIQGYPDTLLLKAISVRANDHWVDNRGLLDPQAPWFPLLAYEMRNFYDLGTTNIPMDRLRIQVRRIAPEEIIDPERVFEALYIEHLGLDQKNAIGSPPDVPDGFVDEEFVDPVTGILFFPDHQPFDPGTTYSGECPPGWGGFLCLDDLVRNVLRRDHTEEGARSNPLVYFAPYVVPSRDTRYYLDVTILSPPEPGGVLHTNVPNPFNPGTKIRFELNLPGRARIGIFDVQGRLVRGLVDAHFVAGPHIASWMGDDGEGRPVSSGVYFYVLETGGHRYARKMVLAR